MVPGGLQALFSWQLLYQLPLLVAPPVSYSTRVRETVPTATPLLRAYATCSSTSSPYILYCASLPASYLILYGWSSETPKRAPRTRALCLRGTNPTSSSVHDTVRHSCLRTKGHRSRSFLRRYARNYWRLAQSCLLLRWKTSVTSQPPTRLFRRSHVLRN